MPLNGTDSTIWVLYISINPGAPLGGSVGQYFPGTFNGTHFEAVDQVARIADFSKDNYAGQFFYNTPKGQDAVSIAWASNWQYSQQVPTGTEEGWRSAMSLPRRNFITNSTRIGYVMASVPYDLSPVLGEQLASNDSLGNSSIALDYSDLYSGVSHPTPACVTSELIINRLSTGPLMSPASQLAISQTTRHSTSPSSRHPATKPSTWVSTLVETHHSSSIAATSEVSTNPSSPISSPSTTSSPAPGAWKAS